MCLSPRRSWLDDRELEGKARNASKWRHMQSGSAPELASDWAWKGTFAEVPAVWQAARPHPLVLSTHCPIRQLFHPFYRWGSGDQDSKHLPSVMQPGNGGAGPYIFFFQPCHAVGGIESAPPVVEIQSPSHWTTNKFSVLSYLCFVWRYHE